MRAPSRKPPPAEADLKYTSFTVPLNNATYFNKTDKWLVIVGVGFDDATATGYLVVVHDEASQISDSYVLTVDTAAGVFQQCLPRKMLVVPGGSFQTTTVAQFTLIQCNSLEDALAIL